MKRTLPIFLALAFLFSAAQAQLSTPALLDTIQHAHFNYFWYQANPANGLVKDRSADWSPCSIAATGFGLSAICIGVDHGWVTREAARDRVLTTLRTFWEKPQGSGDGFIGNFGLFYHWLDMNTATRTWDSELSTIDTGLLLAGIIDAKQYFTGTDSVEQRIRALADSIYYRMDWNRMRNNGSGLAMKWTPTGGFEGVWVGYNEASIMYILALGSPTYPVGTSAWTTWTSGYQWQTHYGQSYVNFPPLFGHQYSHCWIDFRYKVDGYMRNRGIDYFENSRRATLAQRAYSIANPSKHKGYSDSLWGITASDVPGGYNARGAPPAFNDDGTITPTAAASAIAFAPDEVIPVLRNLWNNYRAQIWTPYGFRDAFNLNVNWYGEHTLGIDQGPIVLMIENYRNERVWERFMANEDVQRGLGRAGFVSVLDVEETPEVPGEFALDQNYPNPFNPETVISSQYPVASWVKIAVYDLLGREVVVLVDEWRAAGRYQDLFSARGGSPPDRRRTGVSGGDGAGLASGVYLCRLTAGGFVATRKMVLTK